MTFTIYNEGLLERIFDVPRCGFWYNTYQQIGSFSGTEDIIYKNVKFRQNMSGFGSAHKGLNSPKRFTNLLSGTMSLILNSMGLMHQ